MNLFEKDPFLLVARLQPFWVACMLTTVVWGYWSARLRIIREPLFAGFLIFTAGVVGLATIQPSQSTHAIVFASLAGIGFGAPLILIITGVQLSTPHQLIATATAVTTSSRAAAATVFTAIYAAAFSSRLDANLPGYIGKAAIEAGLPRSSLHAFIRALAGSDSSALSSIPGVNSTIVYSSDEAIRRAFADSLRVVYIIAVPFGVLACIACLFLGDLKGTMNYHVDAPLEVIHAKRLPEPNVAMELLEQH